MSDLLPLPDPDSDELRQMLPGKTHRELYRLLFETRAAPLSSLEIRQAFSSSHGDQSQLERRRRDLYRLFVIEQVRIKNDSSPRWALRGKRAKPKTSTPAISARVRAEVLRLGRCAQCGRTPNEHGVVLVVDHRIPQSWGGSHEIDNLQALCEECNLGKKDYYSSLDEYGNAIEAATQHDEVHRRLAALLLAMSPKEIRSDILELVANFGEAQEDWQKRLRELRELGWEFSVRKEKDDRGRVRSYYKLERHRPLPAGRLRTHITASERRRRASRKAKP